MPLGFGGHAPRHAAPGRTRRGRAVVLQSFGLSTPSLAEGVDLEGLCLNPSVSIC